MCVRFFLVFECRHPRLQPLVRTRTGRLLLVLVQTQQYPVGDLAILHSALRLGGDRTLHLCLSDLQDSRDGRDARIHGGRDGVE